jgi:hypothetical protein
MSRPTSFGLHIRPLFRDKDVEHMSFKFDLSKYDDVKANSARILQRLKATDDSMMPPADDGGPWPEEWISLFERWIGEGHPA